MKHFRIALMALLCVVGVSQLHAQDKNNPWSVGFGVNAVDFYPTSDDASEDFFLLNEFFNSEDHYNMIPSITSLNVSRYLEDGFTFQVRGSINRIDRFGDMEAGDLSYYSVGGAVSYDLNHVFGETGWFDPYASIGGDHIWMDTFKTGSFNGGIGANFWLKENLGLNFETRYKHSFKDEIPTHFQHSLGLVVKFGGTDTDGDGVYDKFDACPEVFGLEAFDGCPDSDNDGIIDSKDDCPNTAGLASLNGCPDADGDGIADKDDACPNTKGTKEHKGCPDTDGDRVIDKNDACPTVAGPAANKGCPWPDTDNDGVLDKDDACVNQAGPASNNGCPQISAAEVAELKTLFTGVYFALGSSEFTEDTPSRLEASAKIMAKYTTAHFVISGHTDSVGTQARNQKLSEKRAAAVKAFLVSKGAYEANLTTKGYGEKAHVDTNMTEAGRAKNRRVGIDLAN